MIRRRNEAGTERVLSHDETLREIMNNAARKYQETDEYRTKRRRQNALAVGASAVIVALVVVGGAELVHKRHKEALHKQHEAEAVIEFLENPKAVETMNLTSAELETVAKREAINGEAAMGLLANGYNTLAGLLNNAAAEARTDAKSTLTPANFQQTIGHDSITLTPLDVLAPPPSVISEIGRLVAGTPISAR